MTTSVVSPAGPSAGGAGDPVTVAMVPAAHPYTRAITGRSPAIRVLPCPEPGGENGTAPVGDGMDALDPEWIGASQFDVMHLHFGVDHLDPRRLSSSLAALRRGGRPLVYTAHDYSVHGGDQDAVGTLIRSAEAVIALTPSAANAIEQRWGRRPVVVAHPHVVPLDRMSAIRGRRARSLRTRHVVGIAHPGPGQEADPLRLLPALSVLAAGRTDVEVRVDAPRSVVQDPAGPEEFAVRDLLLGHARRGTISLHLHDPMTDEDVWDYLSGIDVSVLSHRPGVRSCWLETCHDLGTSVVAPAPGPYGGRGADALYRVDEQGVDAASLVNAVVSAIQARRHELPGLGVTERRRQRQEVVAAHEAVYRSVMGR